MSEDFPPQEQIVQLLADEIAALRRDIQQANATLNRIDKRLKVSFPTYAHRAKPAQKSDAPPEVASELSNTDLQALFDELVELRRTAGDTSFETRLHQVPDSDIIALAHEIGIGTLRSSANKARNGVKRRVHESILLSSASPKLNPPGTPIS